MSMFDDINSLKALQDLLRNPDEQSSDSEDEHLPGGIHKFGPGDIKPPTSRNAPPSAQTPDLESSLTKAPVVDLNKPGSFEQWQEEQERIDRDELESRPSPEYNIAYKQSVTTEDIFLQMGNKTASTASCEEMLVNVEMPDETVGIERMELAVCARSIDLQTPVYRLRLPLPHRIDPDAGSARYDTDRKRLTLRLKMIREFDYVNF